MDISELSKRASRRLNGRNSDFFGGNMYIDELIEILIDMRKICGNLEVFTQHYEEEDTPSYYHKKLIREEIESVMLTTDGRDRPSNIFILKNKKL